MSGYAQPVAPRISLIIPARNEQSYLPRLLDSVAIARDRFHLGAHRIEVIVVDNGSTDATVEIAQTRDCRVTHVTPRIIAAVRNGGAMIARGDVLAFVDADHRIHRNTFNAIDLALATGRFIGGATGAKLERSSLRRIVRSGLAAPLVRLTGADGGLVFCYRTAFEQIGGHDERHRTSDCLMLQLRLLQLGCAVRPRRTVARVTSARAVQSRRAAERRGDLQLATMARLAWWRLVAPWKSAALEGLWYEDGERPVI